jgi:hypothetical protein
LSWGAKAEVSGYKSVFILNTNSDKACVEAPGRKLRTLLSSPLLPLPFLFLLLLLLLIGLMVSRKFS